MENDKKILGQLEFESKNLYEILQMVLKTMREIAEILKKNTSRELKEALATYIRILQSCKRHTSNDCLFS